MFICKPSLEFATGMSCISVAIMYILGVNAVQTLAAIHFEM